jgi:hypothetical protein
MKYFAHMTDGSRSRVDVTGDYGRSTLVGVTCNREGNSRIVFFDGRTGELEKADDWIERIELISNDGFIVKESGIVLENCIWRDNKLIQFDAMRLKR